MHGALALGGFGMTPERIIHGRRQAAMPLVWNGFLDVNNARDQTAGGTPGLAIAKRWLTADRRGCHPPFKCAWVPCTIVNPFDRASRWRTPTAELKQRPWHERSRACNAWLSTFVEGGLQSVQQYTFWLLAPSRGIASGLSLESDRVSSLFSRPRRRRRIRADEASGLRASGRGVGSEHM